MSKDITPAAAPAVPQNVTLTFDQLKELIAEARQSSAPAPAFDVESFARAAAKANQEMGKKENTAHPGISAFSHPEGDVARPRPVMRCDTFWYGDKVNGDRHTYREMELLNQVMPGDYLCSKPDGTKCTVSVTAERHPMTRAFTKIEVTFKPEDGRSVLSMESWLREILEQQASALVTA
jgi:hypothetical protein